MQEELLRQEKSIKNSVNDLNYKVNEVSQSSSTTFQYMTLLKEMWKRRQKQAKGRYSCVFCLTLSYKIKSNDMAVSMHNYE